MMQWSSYGGIDGDSELELSCSKGHRSSLQLQTAAGGRICVLCLSKVITDRTAFLIHRTYAIDELLMALRDEYFSSQLLDHHLHFFVTPVAEALSSSTDESFSRGIMDVVLTLCALAESDGRNLVLDFIAQIARQISAPSLWGANQGHTLHVMGLLLEHHCKYTSCVPDALKNQQNFFPHLVSGLQLPGDEFQGEVLFVLYKLASMQDGMDELLRYCPGLCHAAVDILLKTESDELRINSLAFLIVLAGNSVFDIGLSFDLDSENGNLPSSKANIANKNLCFARVFAEAIKGSLLSSDNQVQASSLQLICLVCPDGVNLETELQILVEEGIVDYVFEILRLSERQGEIQMLAMNVLTLLALEEHSFTHRFSFGLETVLRILEKSVDAPCSKLQMDTLNLISKGLSERPGMLSAARAENLLLLLSKLLRDYAMLVDGISSDMMILPQTFKSACSTLISLTKAPCCASIPNVGRILEEATASAMLSASSDANLSPDLMSLKCSTCLLQAVYEFNQKKGGETGLVLETLGLIELCDLYLFPAFTEHLEKVDDENFVVTIFQTLNLILISEALSSAVRFAKQLASNHCFTVSFELMARFPSQPVRESAYIFLCSLVEKLLNGSKNDYVAKGFPHLPSDPIALLALLERRSVRNEELLSAHHAIIALLSTSYTCNDILATEIEIMAALEQHLLVNQGSTLANDRAPATLKQFVSLYVSAKEALKDRDVAWSLEAEIILESVLRHSKCSDLITSDTPKSVLRWYLQKESLKDLNMVQLLNWFTDVESSHSERKSDVLPAEGLGEGSTAEPLVNLAEFMTEASWGTSLLMSLFDKLAVQGVDVGIRVVAKTLTKLVRIAVSFGHELLRCSFVTSILPLIRRPLSTKVSEITTRSCVELVCQLLYDSDLAVNVTDYRSWVDIANQSASLILGKTNLAKSGVEVLPFLSLVNLILEKSNESNFLTQACEALLRNRDLCVRIEGEITNASSQGAKLATVDVDSVEARLLCAVLIFHLLRFRWALQMRIQTDYVALESSHYIGFKTSFPGCAKIDGDVSEMFRTSIACEDLLKILYFGPPTLKLLASTCIVDIFSQIAYGAKAERDESGSQVKALDMPLSFFRSAAMILQGCVLEDFELVQRNASCCLYWLLQSHILTPEQRTAIASSQWNRLLVDHLVLSLSTPRNASKMGKTPDYCACIALGILRVSPVPDWISSVFSHEILSSIVCYLSEDDISPTTICLFHELLLSRSLTSDHVRKLRDLFQAARRNLYDAGSYCNIQERMDDHARHNSSRILNLPRSSFHLESDEIMYCAVLELATHAHMNPVVNRSFDLDVSAISSDTEAGACTAMIDKFMQESYILFD